MRLLALAAQFPLIRLGLEAPALAWAAWPERALAFSTPSSTLRAKAKANGNGLALAWPGFRPQLFKAVTQGLAPAYPRLLLTYDPQCITCKQRRLANPVSNHSMVTIAPPLTPIEYPVSCPEAKCLFPALTMPHRRPEMRHCVPRAHTFVDTAQHAIVNLECVSYKVFR